MARGAFCCNRKQPNVSAETFLERYENQARKGLFIRPETDAVAHCALGLAGEAGEIADAVKKSQYAPPRPLDRNQMLYELGDVLWYLTNLGDQFNFGLRQIIVANVHKLEHRHAGKHVYSVDGLLGCS